MKRKGSYILECWNIHGVDDDTEDGMSLQLQQLVYQKKFFNLHRNSFLRMNKSSISPSLPSFSLPHVLPPCSSSWRNKMLNQFRHAFD